MNRPIRTTDRDRLFSCPDSRIARTATGRATKPNRWLTVKAPGNIMAFSHGMAKTNRENRAKAERFRSERSTTDCGDASRADGVDLPGPLNGGLGRATCHLSD